MAERRAGDRRAGLTKLEWWMVAGVAVLTVLAGVTRYAGGVSTTVAFIVAAIALAALAWMVSFATQQVGAHFGAPITGMLQATLANLPEFFVVIFALNAGELVVAQTALLGSILVNALLVLGLVIVAGAGQSRDGLMRFSARLPNDTATLLLTSTFIIVLIGLSTLSGAPAGHHVKTISIIGSALLLIVYATWLWRYLRSDEGPSEAASEPRVSTVLAMGLLAVAGTGSAFVSDWFVHALTPTIHSAHISRSFAGLVIVAIAGNAVENVVGIVLAAKGQADLAISVVKNSVAQISAFLFPLLVLVSLATATTLTFSFSPVYAGALFGTAVIIWQVTGDGEATYFEGVSLVGAFVVLAALAWYGT